MVLAETLLSECPALDLTIFDSAGQTPLHNALHGVRGSTEILSLLINSRCDVNTSDNTADRYAPLHCAVSFDPNLHHDVQSVRFLSHQPRRRS